MKIPRAAATLEEFLLRPGAEETIQDAPYAVTAFTARGIVDAGIERVEDFVALTPNVTLATSQGIGTSFLTIRGIDPGTKRRGAGGHDCRRRAAVQRHPVPPGTVRC